MKDLKITVSNNDRGGKRKVVVYDAASGKYRFIPSLNNGGTVKTQEKFSFPMEDKNPVTPDDFLIIAPAPGPGKTVGPCSVKLYGDHRVTLNFTPAGAQQLQLLRSGDVLKVVIPESPPDWELKVSRSAAVILSGPVPSSITREGDPPDDTNGSDSGHGP